MNANSAPPEITLADGDRQAAVSRLLECRQLKRAPRLRQLLQFLAKGTLDDDPESVKEHSIGVAVFGRRTDYNPSDDNIVRVSIRQLRAKIQEYYGTDGRDEQLLVVIPKGKYVLAFERRPAAEMVEELHEEPVSRPVRLKWIPWIMAGMLGCAGIALLLQVRGAQPAAAPRPEKSLISLLAPGAGQKLTLVVEDAGVQAYHRITGRKIELNEYTGGFLRSGNLPAEIPRDSPFHRFLQWSEATEFWSFPVLLEIARVVPPAELSVRHPRSLTVRDFQGDNSLLLGGPFANPWVQLFDHDLNFQIEPRPGRPGNYIRNRAPLAGERALYANSDPGSPTEQCYARIAYLPNLTGRGKILLAGGPHRASSEAAARFITTGDGLHQVMRLFHVRSIEQLPWFELMIEATALGPSPQTMRLAASRRIADVRRQAIANKQ